MNDHRNGAAPSDFHATDKLIVLPWYEPRRAVERRAREYKRTHDLGYNQALDRIAQENSFPNWRVAVAQAFVEADAPHIFTRDVPNDVSYVIELLDQDVRQAFLEQNDLEDFSQVDWSDPDAYSIETAFGTNVERDVGKTSISQCIGWNDAFTMNELSDSALIGADTEKVAFFKALRTPAALTAFRLRLAWSALDWMDEEWITRTPAYQWAALEKRHGALTELWRTRYGVGKDGSTIQAFQTGSADSVLVVEHGDASLMHCVLSTQEWDSVMGAMCTRLNCSEADAEHNFNSFSFLQRRLFVDESWGGLAADE